MPKIEDKFNVFYQEKKAVVCDFSAEAVSSDGGLVLLSKLERKHQIIKEFASFLPDSRNPLMVIHSYYKQLMQRIFLMAQGYEDCNDAAYLKEDPVLGELLENGPCSQPTLCRMENLADRAVIWDLCNWWIDRYVEGINPSRKEIILDVDATDDPTHGGQQLSLFHGHYWQWMYQELLFLDGQTGQMILPILLPGTAHPSKPFVPILKRLVTRIRDRFPKIKIIIRADAGFSSAPFYDLVDKYRLHYCLGISANQALKAQTTVEEQFVKEQYLDHGEKYQYFVGPFLYQAGSWGSPQPTYAKVESTGKGMNVRYFISNLGGTAKEIYFDFYVYRGETSENRIKEIKNMCYSDRLSCHGFYPNFFRLMLSGICYEFFRLIKELIKKSGPPQAQRWMVDNIRLFLLKIGTLVKSTARRIYLRFSKAFAQKQLLRKIIMLC